MHLYETEQKPAVREKDNPFTEKFEAFFKERCMKDVERLANDYPLTRSLLVDFKELEHFDFDLADELLENPDACIEAAELSLRNIHLPIL